MKVLSELVDVLSQQKMRYNLLNSSLKGKVKELYDILRKKKFNDEEKNKVFII